MAWLSSGHTNFQLASSLKENEVIQSQSVLDAFHAVDRGLFVPVNRVAHAYSDSPFRDGHVHLSAPHIYAVAMEELELHEGLSFLNMGSGTGYLSSLVGAVTGRKGINHGIEINSRTLEHSRQSTARYYNRRASLAAVTLAYNNSSTNDKADSESGRNVNQMSDEEHDNNSARLDSNSSNSNHPTQEEEEEKTKGQGGTSRGNNNIKKGTQEEHPEQTRMETESDEDEEARDAREALEQQTFIQNCLERLPAQPAKAEFVQGSVFEIDPKTNMKYDRIYIGASAPESFKETVKELLKLGGIAVAPFEDKLTKIRALGDHDFRETVLSRVMFAPLVHGLGSGDIRNYDEETYEEEEERTRVQNEQEEMNKQCFFHELIWTEATHCLFPKVYQDVIHTLCVGCKLPNTKASALPFYVWEHIFEFLPADWFDQPPTTEEAAAKRLEIEEHERESEEKRVAKAERERQMMQRLMIRLVTRNRAARRGAHEHRDGGNGEQEEGDENESDWEDHDGSDEEDAGHHPVVFFNLGAPFGRAFGTILRHVAEEEEAENNLHRENNNVDHTADDNHGNENQETNGA